jgi:universal stress protein A
MRFFGKHESGAAWNWLQEIPEHKEPFKPVQAYRKLLLATDFSLYSERAAQRAIEIARQYGAQLDVMHIVEETQFYSEWNDPVIADRALRDEALKQWAEGSMRKFAERAGLVADVALEVQ